MYNNVRGFIFQIGFARAACNAGEYTACPSPTTLKPTPKP